MADDLNEKLKQATSKINFNEIKVEILQDVIFLVSSDLNLMEVAKACAEDRKDLFVNWLETKKILKPSQEQLDYWKDNNTIFECSIIKPFVFLQNILLN